MLIQRLQGCFTETNYTSLRQRLVLKPYRKVVIPFRIYSLQNLCVDNVKCEMLCSAGTQTMPPVPLHRPDAGCLLCTLVNKILLPTSFKTQVEKEHFSEAEQEFTACGWMRTSLLKRVEVWLFGADNEYTKKFPWKIKQQQNVSTQKKVKHQTWRGGRMTHSATKVDFGVLFPDA